MAISASKTKTIQAGWNLTASFEETGTSTPNNTSNIKCTARLAPTTSQYMFDFTNAGELYIYWHDNHTNTDTKVAGGTRRSSSSSSNATASGTITATHNADGTLSGYAKAVWTKKYTSSYIPASDNVSTDTKALTNIPRKSTPTISDSVINIPASTGSITITTNRATAAFTHTITLKIGETQIAQETDIEDSVTFAIPDIQTDIFAEIPNARTATITVECETWNGDTSLGTTTATFTANVTDEARPTFPDFTYADTNATTAAITGNNQVLISKKSDLTITITSANKATANYNATMDLYTFTINAQSASESYVTTTIAKNLGTINLANNIVENQAKDLVVAAIDSRGLNKSITKNITVLPYNTPIINASAARQNGFENTTTVTVSGSVSPLLVGGVGKNSVNASTGLQYRYKSQSTTTWGAWNNVATTYNAATGAVSASNFTLNLDNQTAYDIQFQLTDALETATANITVAAGQPAMYIGADDKRVSIGGMPTLPKDAGKNGQLEVLGNAYANGNRLAELPIDASDIGGTFGTNQIADGAVTDAKIGWSSMAPVWTTFVINGTSDSTWTATTKLGNTLTFERANGGTLVKITGATKVIAYRQTIYAKHSANTGDFGLNNTAPKTTFYTRVYSRANNSSKTGTEEISHTTGSEDYFTLATTAGNKTQFRSIAEGWRQPEDTVWEIRGTITADGTYTALDYSIGAKVSDNGKIPVPYLRGATSSNVSSAYMVISVLETN